MTTYPLPTLAPTIDENGISAPAYQDILASLIARAQAIYGSDLFLDPSAQDYQFLAIFALAQHDTNQTIIAVYNDFSPATAIGTGLSSIVKINGIARDVSSNSTVDLIVSGQAGLKIFNAVAKDENGFLWDLDSPTIIDASGQALTTATCETVGAIRAETGTVNQIATPLPGWQSVTNPVQATPGAPVETDAALRARQTQSTSLPSQSIIDGINGGITSLPDVQRLKTYENDTNRTDPDGIPPHTIAVVVEGGDALSICTAIAVKKTPGCGTYGSVGNIVLDSQGVPNFVKFFPLTIVEIYVQITLTALLGYTSTIGQNIVSQETSFISALPIGYDVYLSKAEAATEVPEPDGLTYDVTSVLLRRSGTFIWNTAGHGWNVGRWDGPFAAADVPIGFNEAAECLIANVTLIVNPS